MATDKAFIYSRLWAIATNAFTIASGIVSKQYLRVVGSGINLWSNLNGVYTGYCSHKHKDSPINPNPTPEEIAQPITCEDFEKYLGTHVVARNWAAHFPRAVGSGILGICGHVHNREGEMYAGIAFTAINALPLLKFEDAYRHSGYAGMAASLGFAYAGYEAKDPLLFISGSMNFLFYLMHMQVKNPVHDKEVDGLFTAKLQARHPTIAKLLPR